MEFLLVNNICMEVIYYAINDLKPKKEKVKTKVQDIASRFGMEKPDSKEKKPKAKDDDMIHSIDSKTKQRRNSISK
ncbi:MAG: hypothetical protein K6A23_10345 [Butyrivibrio sp.]|nr:hypothetical protein [Butyrivibrio sp.]